MIEPCQVCIELQRAGIDAPCSICEVPAFPYVWRVRTRLPERFGQRCRIIARGAMNTAHVAFEDGFEVFTSRNYLRKAPAA